jgi:hypothetical protein
VTIKIPVLDGARVAREPRLNPAIATLFELSPQTVAALDSEIAATRLELLELRRQNSTVAQAEDGSIELRSASFAEEGGAAHDALMRAFENALGEEAFRHFLAVADQSLDHDFGYYGAQETTITLGKSLDAEGRAVYPVTRAVARETSSSETTGVFVSPADIWSFDGDALQLIPQAYIEALLAAEPTAPDAPRASR